MPAPAAAAAATDARPAKPPSPRQPRSGSRPRVREYEQPFEEVERSSKTSSPRQKNNNGTSQMPLSSLPRPAAGEKKLADEESKFFNILVEVANPIDLSPILLATVGDNTPRATSTRATACYTSACDPLQRHRIL
ncbi:MAG: hypothetical protein IPK32_23320 [Verrucomicrobiaceae bacterium]|nr:hypothetical protein [Verrucomicrobiaceae bacterium]